MSCRSFLEHVLCQVFNEMKPGKKFKKNEYFRSSKVCRHIGTKKPTGTIEQPLIDTATKAYQEVPNGEIMRKTNGKADTCIVYLNAFQKLSQMVRIHESLVEGA